jgi:N-glycosidase YbiA
VEESRRDAFWGAVADKEEQAMLMGRNIVGRLLMLLRDKLVDNDPGAMHAVPPLMLENFLL